MKFEEMGLSYEILHALDKMGFENATEIQEKAIPLALQGEDLIGQAKTGTGKTAAFGICILEEIKHRNQGQKRFEPRRPPAIVLAPTRELAMQIKAEIEKIGSMMKSPILAVYGGVGIEPQIQALRNGVGILVGTPGRILDLMDRRELDLSGTSIVVLDEADRMLDMGFIDDIEDILSQTQQNRQTLLFSATMPDEILSISRKYMKNPIHLNISQDELVVDKIEQYYLEVTMHNRVSTLLALLQYENPKLAIIFTRTKAGADRLASLVKANGLNAQALHGDMSQNKRDRAMASFKHGHVQVLVATDLASRGLDVREITHVINYDMPMDAETYVHRIGRTGRMEANGKAFTLVFPDQTRELLHYQSKTGARIEKTEVDASSVRVMQPRRLGHSRDDRRDSFGRGNRRDGGRFGQSDRGGEGRRFGGPRRPRRDFGGQANFFAKRDSYGDGANSRDSEKRHGKRTQYVGRQD